MACTEEGEFNFILGVGKGVERGCVGFILEVKEGCIKSCIFEGFGRGRAVEGKG